MSDTNTNRRISADPTSRVRPRRWRTRGLRKAAYVAPRLVASTLLVLVIAPALPDWAGIGLFWGGLTVALLLVLGVGESLAVRALFNARRLTQAERTGLAAVVADLCILELGPPIVDLYVARRRGAPAAIAHGRRSIVMAPEFEWDPHGSPPTSRSGRGPRACEPGDAVRSGPARCRHRLLVDTVAGAGGCRPTRPWPLGLRVEDPDGGFRSCDMAERYGQFIGSRAVERPDDGGGPERHFGADLPRPTMGHRLGEPCRQHGGS